MYYKPCPPIQRPKKEESEKVANEEGGRKWPIDLLSSAKETGPSTVNVQSPRAIYENTGFHYIHALTPVFV